MTVVFSSYCLTFLFFFTLYCLIVFFRKKLLVLLLLEIFMLMNICFFCLIYSSKTFSMFSFFIFSVFMVLESVFGITLLISSSRNSSISSILLMES